MQYKVYARMRYVYLQMEKPDVLSEMLSSGRLDAHLAEVQRKARRIHKKHAFNLERYDRAETSKALSLLHRDAMDEVINTVIKR